MSRKKEKVSLAKKVSKKSKRPIGSVHGVYDILPQEEKWWKMFWEAGRKISELYDFHYIETPIFEYASLFEEGLGSGSKIVEKKLYKFKTKGGEELALRPEGTTPVVRSYLEHQLGRFSSPLKVYYYGPMFRYEKGKNAKNEFHQWGFEIIGDGDPVYDAEIVMALLDFLLELRFKDPLLKVNAVGCRVCLPAYQKRIKVYYRYHKKDLCDDCAVRYEKSPLYLLNCQKEKCRELTLKAPIILDYLCQSCNNHFKDFLELIEDSKINYIPDPYFVGDLGYYSRIVFSVPSSGDATSTLAYGGRHNYLSEEIGGRQLQAVGGVVNTEYVIEEMKKRGESKEFYRERLFFAAVGDAAKKSAISLMRSLRNKGIVVMESLGKKSLNAQLKIAEKNKIPLILIYGQREVFEGTIIIRDVKSGFQESVPLEKMIDEVKKRI